MAQRAAQPYILMDPLWPSSKTSITYSFNSRIFSYSDSNREPYLGASIGVSGSYNPRDVIRDAMDAWEAVCGVEFVEVRDSPWANVRIAWQPSSESDGKGGTLGTCWTWQSRGFISEQAVTFDLADSGNPIRFYDTALHELGHVLGIDHSNVRDVVMSGGLGPIGHGPTPYADPIHMAVMTFSLTTLRRR